jgi:hypothetical protein
MKKYEFIAENNGWSSSRALKNIPIYLEKDATIWWEGMEHKPSSLEEFKTLFLTEFASRHEFKEAEAILRNLTQKEGEKIAVYIRNVRYWCSKVQPPMTEYEVMRQLKNGLLSSYQKLLIKKPPSTVEELIKRIQVEEDYRVQDQMNKKSAAKKSSVFEVNSVPSVNAESKEISFLKEELKDLKELITGIQQSIISEKATKSTRSFNGKPTCWNCSKIGHSARKCNLAPTRNLKENIQRYRARVESRQSNSANTQPVINANSNSTSSTSRSTMMNVEITEDRNEGFEVFVASGAKGTLKIEGVVFNKPWWITVDTGSAVTLINQDFLNALPEQIRSTKSAIVGDIECS